MTLEQLMNRFDEIAILLEAAERTARHRFELCLDRQPNGPLQPIQLAIELGHRGAGILGRQMGGVVGHRRSWRGEQMGRLEKIPQSALDEFIQIV